MGKMTDLLAAVSDAAGIPVILYDGSQYVEKFNFFTPQPEIIYKLLWPLSESVKGLPMYYTITPEYMLCGAVRISTDESYVLLGPATSFQCSLEQARKTLEQSGQSPALANELMKWLHAMPLCTIKRFISVLNLLNRLLNKSEEEVVCVAYTPIDAPQIFTEPEQSNQHIHRHSTINVQKMIESCVEHGKADELEDILRRLPSMGLDFVNFAEDAMRSFKNNFILAVPLISQAAINGGLYHETAEELSENYIRQVEHYDSYPAIFHYMKQMMLDFTRRVARVRMPETSSIIVKRICNYLNARVKEKVPMSELTGYLNLNQSYICRHFKEHTDKTIMDYFNEIKIVEAKYLLKTTDITLAQLAYNLSFSSQNYFQAVFKKYAGCTPKEYRLLN